MNIEYWNKENIKTDWNKIFVSWEENIWIFFNNEENNKEIHLKSWVKLDIYIFNYWINMKLSVFQDNNDSICNIKIINLSNSKNILTLESFISWNDNKMNIDILNLAMKWSDMKIYSNIKVNKSSISSFWELTITNINFSNNSKLDCIPGLDIDSPFSKANHSFKSFYLDKEKLFYLCARWISYKDAQKLFLESFFYNAFKKINFDYTNYLNILL